jgi:hypothetical protein
MEKDYVTDEVEDIINHATMVYWITSSQNQMLIKLFCILRIS